jgi:hypothetical protein
MGARGPRRYSHARPSFAILVTPVVGPPNGAIGWQTPAERWDGTPFTDLGFEHIPALEHLQGWLIELMAA